MNNLEVMGVCITTLVEFVCFCCMDTQDLVFIKQVLGETDMLHDLQAALCALLCCTLQHHTQLV